MILTVKSISKAMKGDTFWMFPESQESQVIEEATKQGYVLRLSHTQVQWKDEEAIEKLDKMVKKTVVNEKAVIYSVDETFNTLEEMFESEIAKGMFEMYEHVIPTKKRIIAPNFQKAYRIGNKIVYELLLDEGFKVLNELHLHSSLSSQSFSSYTIAPDLIFVIKSNYENTTPNRKQFAKQNINVTYIYGL